MKTLEQTTNEIQQEVTALIVSDIEGYEGSTFEDLFFDLFNSDYYIIGTYQAKEWLDEKGALNCLQIMTDWERDVFGEVQFTDFDSPESIVNLTVYCVADRFYNDMLSDLDLDQDSEITPIEIETVTEYTEELQ